MFGFFIGTISLIGLMKMWRHGGRHRGRGFRGGGARRWMMRRLFERLDTSPGQEKVVSGAVDDVQRKAYAARESMFGARADVAKAMRSDTFDSASLNEVIEKQQTQLDELKKSVREGLQSIHEVMTPDQRAALADLIEFGPAEFQGHGGHHRHHGGGPFGRRGWGGRRGERGEGAERVNL